MKSVVDIIEPQVTISENESDAQQPEKRTRAKRGKANPSEWWRNNNKHLREKGKSYVTKKRKHGSSKEELVVRKERVMAGRCTCTESESRQCSKFTETERELIFKNFWELTWGERKAYVKGLVDCTHVKRRRTSNTSSRRGVSLFYHMKKDGTKVSVCKTMFLATTGLREWSVRTWVKDCDNQGTRRAPSFKRGKEEDRTFMRKEFLEKLPKVPSHYCRASSSKLYIEPIFQSMADLHRLYVSKCVEEGKAPMGRKALNEEFNAMNLSLFTPKKDQCDTCVGFSVGNITGEVWQNHTMKKTEARAEKAKDKELALACTQEEHIGEKVLVVTMDLQALLTCPRPKIQASALYYRTKLSVHNFTVYNVASKEALCYIWDETNGGVTANEFASCIVDYLQGAAESYERVIIYSDGCTYQNRNAILANALKYFATRSGKTIEQKILERGHTQMEVDSVHATIEKRIRGENVYTPHHYVQIVEQARRKAPYQVKYLDYSFFKNYTGNTTYI